MTKTPDISSTPEQQWFVLRDLKRANAKLPAYKELSEAGFEVFTPMRTQVAERRGRRIKETVPVIRDLLFVHTTRDELDPAVAATKTLQYRFMKGKAHCTPMVVPTAEMEMFIAAINKSKSPEYLRPEDVTPAMIGSRIRIITAGPMNNREGHLIKIAGSNKRRLLVEIPDLLLAAVEISTADYVEIIE